MTPEQFDHLASLGHNRIPLHCEVLADLDTPLSVYIKLAAQPYSFLYESVQGGEKWGRYSIIGLPAKRVVRVHEKTITVSDHDAVVEQLEVDDPLAWIAEDQRRFSVPEIGGLPVFTGGFVGYFGYDTVRYIEPRLGLNTRPDPIGAPDILLMLTEEVVVFDNLAGKLFVVVHVDPTVTDARVRGEDRLAEIVEQLQQPMALPLTSEPREVNESDFVSGYTEDAFKHDVETCRRYITEGECMQIVLSQRLSIPYQSSPLNLYRALRMMNPSPYMFYLDLGDHYVVGSSPEILVRLDGGEVTVRPIAGTRPRGKTEAEDRALEEDLLADPKEIAEHLMLIDLGRNDTGRVAEIGTVELTDKMVIERYSHVMHIVSNVTGKLRRGLDAIDVLRATFPAGTLSGAPKVRAMEIIDELEPVKRGIYGGAVGYISWQGDMDTAIAIRTAVIKDGMLHIQAGAGLVYDSVPQNEWDETMNKARAVFRAVYLAEKGLMSTGQDLSGGIK
ncbi:MAG: anthranilate synthase component I [Pseudomonadota bacterium]